MKIQILNNKIIIKIIKKILNMKMMNKMKMLNYFCEKH